MTIHCRNCESIYEILFTPGEVLEPKPLHCPFCAETIEWFSDVEESDYEEDYYDLLDEELEG